MTTATLIKKTDRFNAILTYSDTLGIWSVEAVFPAADEKRLEELKQQARGIRSLGYRQVRLVNITKAQLDEVRSQAKNHPTVQANIASARQARREFVKAREGRYGTYRGR